MGIWGIAITAALAGLLAGYLLARFASAGAGLVLAGLGGALAVALVLAGRAEQGWGGIGMVAVATVIVAPFVAGTLGGIGLARLGRRR